MAAFGLLVCVFVLVVGGPFLGPPAFGAFVLAGAACAALFLRGVR